MATKAIFAALFILVAISIGIGVSNNSAVDKSVEEQAIANGENFKLLQSEVKKLKDAQKKDINSFEIIERQIEIATNQSLTAKSIAEKKISPEQIANLQARMLELESQVRTISEKKLVIPTPQETPKKDFKLVTQNAESVEQQVFGINQAMYIVGDAGATDKPTVSLKIRDAIGNIVVEKSLGIPAQGKFSTALLVSPGFSGIYTITVSDGTTVSSTTFEVKQ